jgi:hypothetical protein
MKEGDDFFIDAKEFVVSIISRTMYGWAQRHGSF